MADVLAFFGARFERGKKRFGNFFVSRLREEQRDVDVEPVFQALTNRGKAFGRARNLDHHVRAVHTLPQAVRLRDSGFGVVPQKRRNFQAHVAVAAFRLRVYRPEDIARILNVAERNFLEDAVGVQLLGFGRIQNVGVKIASRDGLLENRRVRGHPAQAVVINVLLQSPAGEQISAHIVHPGRLAVPQQALERIRTFSLGDAGKSGCRRHNRSPSPRKTLRIPIVPLAGPACSGSRISGGWSVWIFLLRDRIGQKSKLTHNWISYTFTLATVPNFSSSAFTFPSRRTWRSSCVNFAPRNAFTKSSASFTPTTREPSTSTLILSCSTP